MTKQRVCDACGEVITDKPRYQIKTQVTLVVPGRRVPYNKQVTCTDYCESCSPHTIVRM